VTVAVKLDYDYPSVTATQRRVEPLENTMKTYEYLDAVRKKLDLPSDYALQKPLGVTKQQLSRYRTGLDSLSDGIALQVAEILQLDGGRVLLDMHIERSKTPEIRAAWASVMEKISESFLNLLSGTSPVTRRRVHC
jgi:hypothetical protein